MVPTIVTAAATAAAVQRLHRAPGAAQEAVELGTSAGFHGAARVQGFMSTGWWLSHPSEKYESQLG